MHAHQNVYKHHNTGSSFKDLVHPEDKVHLVRALTTMIVSDINADRVRRLCLRLQTAFTDHYISLDAAVRHGTQGIHCTMWTQVNEIAV